MGSDEGGSAGAPDAPTTVGGPHEAWYVERRRASSTLIGILLAIAAGSALFVARELRAGTPLGTFLPAVLVATGGLLILAVLIAAGPLGNELKHIRVDRSGLRLGRRLLPADEIGRCTALTEAEAGRAALRWRYDGIKIGRGSYNPIGSKGPAVFVEQRRPGRRWPGWLISTDDPEGLVTALHRLRGETRARRS
ncbi:MAG: DUF3093 family protein [Egibacteraceae bacterium]